MTPSTGELGLQFARVKRNGWLGAFKTAGYSIEPALLLAIGSRETNLQNICGDIDPITRKPHGYGIMQIDDRSFPEWCRSGKWQNVPDAVRMGAMVLQSKINGVHANERVLPKDIIRVAVAAYNAGPHAISGYLIHGDPDYLTTGHDYSRDVMARYAIFRGLLDADGRANR